MSKKMLSIVGIPTIKIEIRIFINENVPQYFKWMKPSDTSILYFVLTRPVLISRKKLLFLKITMIPFFQLYIFCYTLVPASLLHLFSKSYYHKQFSSNIFLILRPALIHIILVLAFATAKYAVGSAGNKGISTVLTYLQ